MITFTERQRRLFFQKVSPCPITGCWWWTAAVDQDGYGKFQTGTHRNQRHWRAPRVSLALVGIDIESDQIALHTCDQPSCVNPAHLRLGSPKENARDCLARGRRPRVSTNKLHEIQVVQIFQLAALNISQPEIGARVGVHRKTVNNILNGKTWSHIGKGLKERALLAAIEAEMGAS